MQDHGPWSGVRSWAQGEVAALKTGAAGGEAMFSFRSGSASTRSSSGGRRWRGLILVESVTLALVAALVVPALAVHDDALFELDRNAVNTGVAGEDWNQVCPDNAADGAATCIGGTTADASSWKLDAVNASGKDTTLFTGGATKDDLDIPGWKFTSGAGPDKDDLSHGYAARYDDHLYFGTDRFAATGDATVGVWFFQQNISPITSGPNAGKFTNEHTNGDVLVLSDFTKGGEVATARVFEWHSPGGAINGTLDLISGTTTTPADCVGPPQVGNNDPVCATVNAGNTDSPWAFQAKEQGSPAGVFPKGHFLEGGIDLEALGLGGCFSSYLIESRASTSIDSVLKDFVGGTFAECDATAVSTPQSGGSAITSALTIGASGTVSVQDKVVVTGEGSSSPPRPTGTVKFYICGPTATTSTALCTTGGTNIPADKQLSHNTGDADSANSATSDSHTVTEAGRYCFRADYLGDANYPDGASDSGANECFIVSPRIPTISTSATAGPVTPGTAIDDTATLGNTANDPDGSAADGTITFRLYGPDDATCATVIATRVINVSGDGNYKASDGTGSGSLSPTTPGTYRWIASYSGDLPNTTSVSGACNDTGEASVVTKAPSSLSSAQKFYPNDSATVSASAGGNVTGSVTFDLYDSLANCQAADPLVGQLYTETVTLAGGSTSETVETSNTTVSVPPPASPGALYWTVTYSGDSTHHGRVSTCAENTTFTFTDDAGPGTQPA